MCRSVNKNPGKQCILLALAFFVIITHATFANCTKKSKHSKNILVFMGYGSYSMRLSIWPLIEALSEKGHQVTYVSSYESRNPQPGIIDYVPKKLQLWWAEAEKQLNLYESRKTGTLLQFWLLIAPQIGIEVCTLLYDDQDAVKWIKNSKFDLVFIDTLFNDCAYGLAHVFQAKTILISTTTIFPWFYDAFGIPDDSSWATTETAFGLPVRDVNFFHRVIQAIMPVVWKLIRELYYYPELERITKDALQLESVPSFSEMEKHNTLVFITTHYSQEFPRSFPPNVVPIGGLVLTGEVKPLPKDIQDFIDKGENGFIYISFGTLGEFSSLDKQVREEFINALLQFPNIQFVWKAAKGIGMELPGNFMILKWAPQQDLLAHPKIKAFVTHAGLGSINEAIYHVVPMVSFPIFAEQDYNANLLEAKKIGIKLEMTTLKSNQLKAAIIEITGNPRIKENMKKVSSLFKKRPQSPLQTSLWWTEYVLEHETADLHEILRPPSVNQSWWVRRQLDAWLFIILVLIVALSIPFCILKYILVTVLRNVCRDNNSSKAKKIKKN